jgi:hypothetical protein
VTDEKNNNSNNNNNKIFFLLQEFYKICCFQTDISLSSFSNHVGQVERDAWEGLQLCFFGQPCRT